MSSEISAEVWPLRRLQLEVVNVCNFRCPLCRTLDHDDVIRRRMTVDEFRSVVEPLEGQLELLSFYGTRGEPLLHKNLPEMVEIANSIGVSTVISTNSSLITPENARELLEAGLSEIMFAIDGVSEASYSTYRVGGDFHKVIGNVETFCRIKQEGGFNTHTVFQFIPMAANEHEVPRVGEFGYKLGVDEVRIKLSSSVASSEVHQPQSNELRPRALQSELFECPSGLDKLYVDPNGDCFPCCYAEGHEGMRVGNALQDDIRDVWQSPQLWELRRSFAQQSGFCDFCMDKCRNKARKQRISVDSALPIL